MGSLSDYAENKLLDLITGKAGATPISAVSPCWVALATSAPTDATIGSTLVEPTTPNGYARKITVSSNWDAAASGATQNASVLTFATATNAGWGTITHFALVDSATPGTGNVVGWGALTTSKTISVGDTASFAAGDIDITMD